MNKIAERALSTNSNSVKRLNPHVYGDVFGQMQKAVNDAAAEMAEKGLIHEPKPAKRIRQSNKPVLNKLEQEWLEHLKSIAAQYEAANVSGYDKFLRLQAKRYQVGNGLWYKPDITAGRWPHPDIMSDMETAWEVKGPKQMKGIARGMVVLKAAAHQWPEVRFILVWKEGNEWREQIVLP